MSETTSKKRAGDVAVVGKDRSVASIILDFIKTSKKLVQLWTPAALAKPPTPVKRPIKNHRVRQSKFVSQFKTIRPNARARQTRQDHGQRRN